MPSRARILVVDDDPLQRAALSDFLRDEGYSVETASDGFRAVAKLEEYGPDLVLTDLRMPGLDGIGVMRRALENDPDVVVILITGHADVESSVAAMRQGAADYLTKPARVDELCLIIERELERRRLRSEAGALRRRLSDKHRLPNLIGSDPSMKRVVDGVLQVAPSRATVLITGESGTGKELVASAIHEHSPRSTRPFVKLHCAALSEALLEAELFGHERGAVTGAVGRRDGRCEQADGGTLFLDEIGEIAPAVQVKLLRFLQDHEFERVGGNQTIKVDVRVVAATHRDLEQRVADGEFREDLFYRLHVVTIHLPALRERRADIPALAAHFLRRSADANDRSVRGFTDDALERMVAYPWPGNVRELENVIERAVVVCRGEMIDVPDLSLVRTPAGELAPPIPGASLAEVERYTILKTLEWAGGNKAQAARVLGISTRKIQYKLHEYQGDADVAADAPGSRESPRSRVRRAD